MEKKPKRYRSIWVSDLHLGTLGSKDKAFLQFLKETESEFLFLVGDIVDGWRLAQSWYWPQSHNDVIQKLLRKVRKGTKLVYIPGNHDEFARDFVGTCVGDLQIEMQAIHILADGRRVLVLHGDEYDWIIRKHKWLGLLGTRLLAWVHKLSRLLCRIQVSIGIEPWSLAAHLKSRSKEAGQMGRRFVQAVSSDARAGGFDAVVCGHVHRPEACFDGDFAYYNLGDWVDHCTALVEDFDGKLELVCFPTSPC